MTGMAAEDEMIQDAQSGVFECVQEGCRTGNDVQVSNLSDGWNCYWTVLTRIVLVHRCGQIPHQLL